MPFHPRISIQADDFNMSFEYQSLSIEHVGAVATFVGRVRKDNSIDALLLEHYPGMTEKVLLDIAAEAADRWLLLDLRIIHRIGLIATGEQIVFVGIASEHRADAFAACEFVMDFLKTQAPLWKKEISGSDAKWVSAKQSDADKTAHWG